MQTTNGSVLLAALLAVQKKLQGDPITLTIRRRRLIFSSAKEQHTLAARCW
jgi:hypothetical protein